MAEKKIIELEVNTNLDFTVTALKKAQREVAILSEKFGATSVQAVEAAKKTAILKDKIGDAKNLTDAFNPDAKFKALTGTLVGVAGGFSVVTGALGAFGKQNEDVEKALLKVQSAMAIASGAQAIGESIDSFKQLGAVIKATSIYQGIYNFIQTGSVKATAEATVAKVADTTATVAQGTASVATGVAITGAASAAKALRVALITSGVGAAAIVVGYLVSKFMDASEASNKLNASQKASADAAKEQSSAIAKESVGFISLIAQLKATNNGSAERKKLIKEVNATYGTTFTNLKDETKFQSALNEEVKNYIAYQRAKYELQKNDKKIQDLIAKQDEITIKRDQAKVSIGLKNLVDLNKSGKDAPKINDSGKAAEKIIADSNAQLKVIDNTLLALGLSASGASAQIDVLTNNGKKFGEQTQKDTPEPATIDTTEKDRLKQLNADIASIEEESRVGKLTNRQKEEDDLDKKYDKLIADGKVALIDVSKLEEDKRLAKIEITNKYNKIDIETKKESDLKIAEATAIATAKQNELDLKKTEKIAQEKLKLDELTLTEDQLKLEKLKTDYEAQQILYKDNAVILLALKKKYEKDVVDVTETAAEKEKSTARKVLEKKIEMTMDGLSIINDLFQMNTGKSEKDQRKAFKAQKAFNLATALTNTYLAVTAALTKVPLTTDFPGQRFIEAGLAGAAGAVQVAKIAKTQFDSGSGSVDTSVPTPTMSAPQFNVVGQSGINQLANLTQQPIQAYVVSGQVTSQQALDRSRLENATLGG